MKKYSMSRTGSLDLGGSPNRWRNTLIFAAVWSISVVPSHNAEAVSGVTGAGLNNFQQITVPNTVAESISVAAGREFSFALMGNGSVVGWGHPGENRAKPPVNLAGVIAISAGSYHTLALKADGTVTGWGFNGNAILDIPADLGNVLAIAAGGYHSLALRKDGTVVGWGLARDGRTKPPADLRDVVAIDAGRDHSVALKDDGTVVAWGLNDLHQTDVPAGLTGVVAIAAGENHTLALKEDGTVVAWGLNEKGQTTIPAGLTGVVAIAAGAQHSMALKSNGAAQGWGDNSKGQLNFAGSDIRGVAAGGYHSLALRSTGPLITSQPRGRASTAGGTVTFSATATGSGLSYQWQLNGRDITGATGSTLSINDIGRTNAGIYTVKVTGAGGVAVSQNSALIVHGRIRPAAPQRLGSGAIRLTFRDEFGDPLTTDAITRYKVEVSEDLQTWVPLNRACALNNGRLQVDDPEAMQFSRRFYRLVNK